MAKISLRNQGMLTIVSICYVVLTGLLVGAALGILVSPDEENILNGRIIGSAIIGVYIGISLGIIFSLRLSSILFRKEQRTKSVLDYTIGKPEQASATSVRPPLL